MFTSEQFDRTILAATNNLIKGKIYNMNEAYSNIQIVTQKNKDESKIISVFGLVLSLLWGMRLTFTKEDVG